MELNVENWKMFKISDYFDVTATITTPLSDLENIYEEGEYPYITTQSTNNGVAGFYNVNTEKGNVLTIDSAVVGKCFYQKDSFSASDHVEKLIPKFNMSFETGIFIVTIINLELYKYSYGRKRNKKIIRDESIKLPQDKFGEPDFLYMSEYIKSLKNTVNRKLDNIWQISKGDLKTIKVLIESIDSEKFNKWSQNTGNKYDEINTCKWEEYKIGDLFNTYTGVDLILENISEGDIPVVTHSAVNNSIGAYSAVILGQMLFDHTKTISLADRGTFFATIQNEDFYIGTRVKALVAKFKCTPYILLFIATIINNERFRFNYGRNCTGGLDELVISLPSKTNNIDKFSIQGLAPDWEYMENYIKGLPYSKRV